MARQYGSASRSPGHRAAPKRPFPELALERWATVPAWRRSPELELQPAVRAAVREQPAIPKSELPEPELPEQPELFTARAVADRAADRARALNTQECTAIWWQRATSGTGSATERRRW